MRRIAAAGLLLIALGACTRAAPTIAERAHTVESQVWSPYCPGRLLVDCTTTQARELRDQIERRLESGDTPDEVLTWIRSNYGDEALARPPGGGRGLAIWLVPAGAFLAGAVVVAGLVRHRGTPAEQPAASDLPPMSDAERAVWIKRVRDEVERDG